MYDSQPSQTIIRYKLGANPWGEFKASLRLAYREP
jgi:hypothetical protein